MLLPVNQEADDPLTGGDRHFELGELLIKDFRDNGVERRAEVHKQDPGIRPWVVEVVQYVLQSHVDSIIRRPVCPVGKLQGVQQGSYNVLQVAQHQSLKGLHDHRRQGDRPVVI